MKPTLLFLMSILYIEMIPAQPMDSTSIKTENVGYGEYAGVLFAGNLSINYERNISGILWLRMGWGYGYYFRLFAFPTATGTGPLVMIMLLSEGTSKLETGIGLSLIKNLSDEWKPLHLGYMMDQPPGNWQVYPCVCIGYRFQRDKKGDIFRIGIEIHPTSTPLYIATGITF